MPAKRRKAKDRQHRITTEAVEFFRACLAMQREGEIDNDSYADSWNGLYFALGLKPWEANPLDVPDDGPRASSGASTNAYCLSWSKAQELRRLLLKAASEK